MSDTQDKSRNQKWYKQFWPWFLLVLPLTVIVACLYTIYLAVDNPLSLVKDDYYKEGLTINQDKQLYANARSLGLVAQLSLDVDNRIVCRLSVNGPRDSGSEALSLLFHHPVNGKKDIQFVLSRQNDSYLSESLSFDQKRSIEAEERWYIYLESSSPRWAMQTEGVLSELKALTFSAGES